MSSAPDRLLCRPERWLILSAGVMRSIEAVARDQDQPGLLRLRLQYELIRCTSLADWRQQLHAAPDVLHLVFECIDGAAASGLGERPPGGQVIQLHDWRRSPGDVLMSLDAPDQAVVQALLLARADATGAPLVLSGIRAAFGEDCLHALARWERRARLELGQQFDALYSPQPIDWGRIVRLPSSADFVAWFCDAALKGLLRQPLIQQTLTPEQSGSFKERMATWSRTFVRTAQGLVDSSRAFHDICADFDLFGIVGAMSGLPRTMAVRAAEDERSDLRRAAEVGERLASRFR